MTRKNSALPRPEAILWDWDNTLVDTWPVIAASMNETLIAMGQEPWTDAQVRERVGGSLRDTFPSLFGDRWEEAGEIYLSAFERQHLEKLRALPQAEDALKATNIAGLYSAIVSNKTGHNLRTEVSHLGWEKYFSATVGATDAAQDKPAPDPVLMALEPSGLTPSPSVWFIGDTPTDMQCAYAAKCTAILIHAEPPHPSRYADAMPHAHFTDLEAWTLLLSEVT